MQAKGSSSTGAGRSDTCQGVHAMPEWEYRKCRIETSSGHSVFTSTKISEDYVATLNRFGKDGWELVAAVVLNGMDGRSDAVEFVLKRPLAEDAYEAG